MRRHQLNPKYMGKAYQLKQRREAEALLKSSYFVFEPITCTGVMRFNKQTCKPETVAYEKAMSLKHHVSAWTIVCYVLAREKNGKNKLTPYEVNIETPCKHEEICDHVAKIHWQIGEEYPQQDNILTLGWIASKLGSYPTEEQAYDMFEQLGAWHEILAPWEAPE